MKITIRGKTYNLNDAADVVAIQNALVPDNWPGKKADCVRNFLACQNIVKTQIARHLAANFKVLSKEMQEQVADGGSGKLGVSFTFELDQTSPLVAAISKIKMSSSVRRVTLGKPQTVDLTQSELPLSEDEDFDMTPGALDKERAEADRVAKEEAAAAKKVESFPGAAPEGAPVAAVSEKVEPAKVDKKRNRKKK